MTKIYIELKILNSIIALETPHVPRRVQRVETRGLERLCKGDCEELKAAKQQIAELMEENRLLRAKLERVNEDLQASQEAQLGSQLRYNLKYSLLVNYFYFSQLSVASHPNDLLKIETHGCVKKFSIRMVRLGLQLLVDCFMSARMIPSAMKYILNAANVNVRDDSDLPARTYFTDLRSMLKPINRVLLREFVNDSNELVLGIDESPRRIGASNVIAITLTNENGDVRLVQLAEHNERTDEAKSTLDTRLVISMLQEEFDDEFNEVGKKILTSLTDSCRNAEATRKKVCKRLDELVPLESPRQALPCTAHIANIAAEDLLKLASGSRRLEKLSRKCGSTIARPFNQAQDNIFVHWHQLVPSRNFQYKHGKRFFHMLDNVLLAFLEFSNLKTLVELTKSSSLGAKEILELIADDSISVEMAICAAMKPILDYFWSDFSTQQTGLELQIKLTDMKLAHEQIESYELDVLDYLNTFSHNADALEAQNKIIDEFVDIGDFNDNLRTVFLQVTSKVLRCMEPYLETDEPSHLRIPHNISVERFI